MINFPVKVKNYFLVKPGEFEERETEIISLPDGFSLLSPRAAAICGSDVHYYKGEKTPEKLLARLPIVLLHEGVCVDLVSGARVVPLAGYDINAPKEFRGRENLWPGMPYMGATAHGLARTHFLYPKELTLPVPTSITDEVGALTEPFSVAIKAVTDINVSRDSKIAIIGTGGLAYLLTLALRFYKNISEKNISVFGVSDESLKMFRDLAQLVNYKERKIFARPSLGYEIVFEAVGGPNMQKTLSFAFDLVMPGGRLGVLGIADNDIFVPVNRLVNNGISVIGLTRSTRNDYELALRLLGRSDIHRFAERLVGAKSFLIDSVGALKNAFEYAARPGTCGRVVVKWPQQLVDDYQS